MGRRPVTMEEIARHLSDPELDRMIEVFGDLTNGRCTCAADRFARGVAAALVEHRAERRVDPLWSWRWATDDEELPPL